MTYPCSHCRKEVEILKEFEEDFLKVARSGACLVSICEDCGKKMVEEEARRTAPKVSPKILPLP